MWAAVALTALTLTPAQAGDLEIKNVRLTEGLLGQTRKDNKILAGEIVVVSYDVHGVKVKADGGVDYSTSFELSQKGKDKPLLKLDPEKKDAVNTLGGNVLPSFTFASFGLDADPGTYTIKVTVQDLNNKKSATFSKEVEVLPRRLGFVRARLMSAAAGPIPPVAIPGQAMMLQYSVVGFTLNKEGSGDVTIEVSVVDDAGKPTVETPAKSRLKPAMAKAEGPAYLEFKPIPLQLNRPGKFKVIVKATDHLSKGATAAQEFDIRVLDTEK